jgi:hypothetical protein
VLNVAKLGRFVTNHQHLRIIQNVINAAPHQLRDMWYLALDVLLVRAEEFCERNVRS